MHLDLKKNQILSVRSPEEFDEEIEQPGSSDLGLFHNLEKHLLLSVLNPDSFAALFPRTFSIINFQGSSTHVRVN